MTASPAFSYETLVTRNRGYVSDEVQARIRATTLLVAGCGIGSSQAICAARMGFERFVLVDGDTVDAHNLNRQFYDFADVGRPKVQALRDAILRINPQAQVEAIHANLDANNTAAIVASCDMVFDTVDFLDLPAILTLHGTARALGKPVFTALSVGQGALLWYFPAGNGPSLADVIAPDVNQAASGGAAPSYADVFGLFIQRLVPYLDQEVIEQVSKVLTLMKEGRPCPASQLAIGSFAIAALALSMILDMLAGHPIPASPQLVIHSFHSQKTTIVDLSSAG
jgi:molybdopterin/thiamine biosynthesis adenylyltransferase